MSPQDRFLKPTRRPQDSWRIVGLFCTALPGGVLGGVEVGEGRVGGAPPVPVAVVRLIRPRLPAPTPELQINMPARAKQNTQAGTLMRGPRGAVLHSTSTPLSQLWVERWTAGRT